MNNYVPLTYRAGDATVFHVQWIPRSLNVYADNISRIIDHDDWSITSEFYDHLNSMYDPFTLDCLAFSNTAKCRKFYSKFWCPGTSGVDAFSFDWSNENCWLVPSVYSVIRTVHHIEYCKI